MNVNYVPAVHGRETTRRVETREEILALNRQMYNIHTLRQELFELSPSRRKCKRMAVIDLFVAKLNYIAFNSAFFELRDYVKNFHSYLFPICDFALRVHPNAIICKIPMRCCYVR